MNVLAASKGFLNVPFLVDGVAYILNTINSFVGNYGLSIILTTVFVRLLLLPLTLKQEKSMKRMKELEPKLNELKKKYENDKETLNVKTMELYKNENVNPLSGCLPLLIQLPIFIALFNVFNSDLIPKDTKFLWFYLSKPDNLFTILGYSVNLLPILTTVLTFIQQKLMQSSQKSDDAMAQSMQSMMYVMPIMMLFLFYNMASGLTLYYFVNTALGILQQYYVLSRRD